MRHKLFLYLLTTLCVLSCQDINIEPQIPIDKNTFHGILEQYTTKTYIDTLTLRRWHKGDQVVTFVKNAIPQKFQLKDEFAGQKSGNLVLVDNTNESQPSSDTQTEAIISYYPYSEVTLESKESSDGLYRLDGITFPSNQQYDSEHMFAPNTLPMIAITTKDDQILEYKNLYGILTFHIKGNANIKQISLKGNTKEKISGKASVAIQPDGLPSITLDENATEEIILNCGDAGINLSPEKAKLFMIALAPVTFENGFQLTITDTEDNYLIKKTTAPITIKRSDMINIMNEIIFDLTPMNPSPGKRIPDNQIWYTSTDGKIITPSETYDKQSIKTTNICSNTYKNNIGILSFDKPVTKVDRCLFYRKEQLETIVLPETVQSIGDSSFCATSLKEINLHENITEIGDLALAGIKMTDITLPKSLQHAGAGFLFWSQIEKITIPGSLKTIPWGAFAMCENLTDVTICNGVQCIERDAFFECWNLTELIIPDSIVDIRGPFNPELTKLECKFIQPTKEIIIGNRLVGLAPNDFQKISISEGITEIGYGALRLYTNLSDITIPESVTTIGDNAFSGTSIRTIKLPDSITEIGYHSFGSCYALEEIHLPKNLRKMGDQQFLNCQELREAEIPGSLEVIEWRAFTNTALSKVIIKEGVKIVSSEAFTETDLKSITLPSTIQYIGEAAFEFTELDTLYCKAKTPPTYIKGNAILTGDIFDTKKGIDVIYVPKKSVEKYKAAEIWGKHADRIVGYDFPTQK